MGVYHIAITDRINELVIKFVGQIDAFQRELQLLVHTIRHRHIHVGGTLGAFDIIAITARHSGQIITPVGDRDPRAETLAFEICQATEKALIAQVVESIDSIYLRALLNRTTGQYAANLRDVLTHLFTTHGKVTPQQIRTKEHAICNMAFDISQPVDTVFNAIDDLADLAEHANSALSQQQMMDLAYVIFAKHPILQQDLRSWNRMTIVQRTWANMITHFREAQEDLSSLPTAGDIFHQANSMSTMADLVAQRLLEAMPTPPQEAEATPDTVNTVITQREISLAAREAALLTQMQEMMTMLRTGTVNTHTQQRRNNRGRGGGNGGGRNNTTTSTSTNGGGRRAPGPRQYCWSHGACAHSSSNGLTTN